MRHWRTVIPLAALLVVLIGFVSSKVAVRREPLLVISPPPAAALPDLEFPARDAQLDGRVVGADGKGVKDALVWLRAGGEPHWKYTQEDGSFHLDELGPVPWSVTVLARGFTPWKKTFEDAAAARTIDIGAPVPPPPSLPPLVRSDLAGRVTSSVKTDLDGCEVLLTPVLPPETVNAPVPRRARVDGLGRFVFEGLIAGRYRVEVLPAWAAGGSWPDLARALDSQSARVVEHPGGDLEIALACGEIRGVLVSTDKLPLEGAFVQVAPSGDPSRVGPPITTAADGSFVARDLQPGAWQVGVRAGSGQAQQTVQVEASKATEASFAPLSVHKGP